MDNPSHTSVHRSSTDILGASDINPIILLYWQPYALHSSQVEHSINSMHSCRKRVRFSNVAAIHFHVTFFKPGLEHRILNDATEDFEFYSVWWDEEMAEKFIARNREELPA